jgi:hypothetical protein
MQETTPLVFGAALLDPPRLRAEQTRKKANTRESEFLSSVQEFVDYAIELPASIRRTWEGLRRLADQGEVEAVRAVTGAFLHILAQQMDIVQEAQMMARRVEVVSGRPLSRADQLASAASDLERLRLEALTGWNYPFPGPFPLDSLVPVWMDEHADIYAGRSRVPLDTIIDEFKAGASPEQIASGYDTLQLAEIEAVISYYLRYRDVVDAYLARREAEADELRKKIEAAQPPNAALKAQIKERWASKRDAHASPAE